MPPRRPINGRKNSIIKNGKKKKRKLINNKSKQGSKKLKLKSKKDVIKFREELENILKKNNLSSKKEKQIRKTLEAIKNFKKNKKKKNNKKKVLEKNNKETKNKVSKKSKKNKIERKNRKIKKKLKFAKKKKYIKRKKDIQSVHKISKKSKTKINKKSKKKTEELNYTKKKELSKNKKAKVNKEKNKKLESINKKRSLKKEKPIKTKRPINKEKTTSSLSFNNLKKNIKSHPKDFFRNLLERRANNFENFKSKVQILKKEISKKIDSSSSISIDLIKRKKYVNNVLDFLKNIEEQKQLQERQKNQIKLEATNNRPVNKIDHTSKSNNKNKKGIITDKNYVKKTHNKLKSKNKQKTKEQKAKEKIKNYEKRFRKKIGKKGQVRLLNLWNDWQKKHINSGNIESKDITLSVINEFRRAIDKLERNDDRKIMITGGLKTILNAKPNLNPKRLRKVLEEITKQMLLIPYLEEESFARTSYLFYLGENPISKLFKVVPDIKIKYLKEITNILGTVENKVSNISKFTRYIFPSLFKSKPNISIEELKQFSKEINNRLKYVNKDQHDRQSYFFKFVSKLLENKPNISVEELSSLLEYSISNYFYLSSSDKRSHLEDYSAVVSKILSKKEKFNIDIPKLKQFMKSTRELALLRTGTDKGVIIGMELIDMISKYPKITPQQFKLVVDVSKSIKDKGYLLRYFLSDIVPSLFLSKPNIKTKEAISFMEDIIEIGNNLKRKTKENVNLRYYFEKDLLSQLLKNKKNLNLSELKVFTNKIIDELDKLNIDDSFKGTILKNSLKPLFEVRENVSFNDIKLYLKKLKEQVNYFEKHKIFDSYLTNVVQSLFKAKPNISFEELGEYLNLFRKLTYERFATKNYFSLIKGILEKKPDINLSEFKKLESFHSIFDFYNINYKKSKRIYDFREFVIDFIKYRENFKLSDIPKLKEIVDQINQIALVETSEPSWNSDSPVSNYIRILKDLVKNNPDLDLSKLSKLKEICIETPSYLLENNKHKKEEFKYFELQSSYLEKFLQPILKSKKNLDLLKLDPIKLIIKELSLKLADYDRADKYSDSFYPFSEIFKKILSPGSYFTKSELNKLNYIEKTIRKASSGNEVVNFLNNFEVLLDYFPNISKAHLEEIDKLTELLTYDRKNNLDTIWTNMIKPLFKLTRNIGIESLKEILKEISKIHNRKDRTRYLDSVIFKLFEINPGLNSSRIKQILQKIKDINIDFSTLHKLYNPLVKKYLSNPERYSRYFEERINNLEKNHINNWNKIEDISKLNKLSIWDLIENEIGSWNVNKNRFNKMYEEYKKYNEDPLYSTNKNGHNLSLKLETKTENKEIKLKESFNKKILEKYNDYFNTNKESIKDRYINILTLTYPERYKEIGYKQIDQRIKEENLNEEVFLKFLNKSTEKLIKEEKIGLAKSVLLSGLPYIAKERGVEISSVDLNNPNQYKSFINKVADFFVDPLKEYIVDNFTLSKKEKEEFADKFKAEDLKNQRYNITEGGDTQKINLEFKTSKNVLDAFCGVMGDNCISKNYNIDFLKNKHFQPINMINSKTGKNQGTILTYVKEINGKKSLISIGIEPKSRFLDSMSRDQQKAFVKKSIEALKDIAEYNNIENIYLSNASGSISNRQTLIDIIKGTYFKEENKESTNFTFPKKGTTIKELYKI